MKSKWRNLICANETMKWCVKLFQLENWYLYTHISKMAQFSIWQICESLLIYRKRFYDKWPITPHNNINSSNDRSEIETLLSVKHHCYTIKQCSLGLVFESKIRHFLILFHWSTFCTTLLMRAMFIDKLICVI